jgi:hypothetical protein
MAKSERVGIVAPLHPEYVSADMVQLRAEITDEIPILFSLTPAEVARLGRSLLCMNTVCNTPTPVSPGTRIGDCQFPVVKWSAGFSDSNGEPALILEIPGGVALTFQMSAQVAQDAGVS